MQFAIEFGGRFGNKGKSQAGKNHAAAAPTRCFNSGLDSTLKGVFRRSDSRSNEHNLRTGKQEIGTWITSRHKIFRTPS